MRYDILGAPVAKGRPRFNRRSGRTYTPQKTKDYEKLVRSQVEPAESWNTAARFNVRLDVYYKTRIAIDLDNTAKAVLDALNGVLWDDDSQIDGLAVIRHYDKDNPRVELLVEQCTRNPFGR